MSEMGRGNALPFLAGTFAQSAREFRALSESGNALCKGTIFFPGFFFPSLDGRAAVKSEYHKKY